MQSAAHFMRYVLIANLQNNPNYIYPKNYINPISGLHNPILYNYGGAGPSTSTPPMDFSPTVTLWSKAQNNIFEYGEFQP